MRRRRETSAPMGVRQGNARRFAVLLGLLALLLNQALLPSLHRAHHAAAGSASDAIAHHAHGGTPGVAAPDGGGSGRDDGPQSCHFCRLASAALPPPPDVVIAVKAQDIGPAWRRLGLVIAQNIISAPAILRAGRPSSSDRHQPDQTPSRTGRA